MRLPSRRVHDHPALHIVLENWPRRGLPCSGRKHHPSGSRGRCTSSTLPCAGRSSALNAWQCGVARDWPPAGTEHHRRAQCGGAAVLVNAQ
jgi:hypothetical protein